jgi:hypothetical protein
MLARCEWRPDFLVVGGHKCGTTSLHTWLDGVPGIEMSTVKEPHYLVRDAVRGRLHVLVDSESDYVDLWSATSARALRGEASVLYLTFADELVASLRSEFDQPPRLVVVVRNPIARARSSFLDVRLKNPDETATTFDEMVAREIERGPWRTDGDGTPTLRHLALSRYARHITTLADHVGEERLHVVVFDDLTQEQDQTFAGILEFLGVEPGDLAAAAVGKAENVGGTEWRSGPVAAAMRHPASVKARRMVAGRLPSTHKWMSRQASRHLSRRAPPMVPETFDTLSRLFEPEVRELEDLLHRDLRHWLHQP